MSTDNLSTRSGIYQIRCIAIGKVYIGSAMRFDRRWGNHRRELSKGTHHSPHLQAAWLKYGPEGFVFEILEVVPDAADLIAAEQAWFDKVQPFDRDIGFNHLPTAGSALGSKRTPETRAKIAAAGMGKRPTPETRAKRSAALKGRKPSPQSVAATAAFWTGRKQSPEARAKMSESLKTRPCKPETRAKRSAALKGRKPSPQTIAAVIAAHLGTKRSPEMIAKCQAAKRMRQSIRRGKRQMTLPFIE